MQLTQVLDVVQATLDNLPKAQWTDLSYTLQKYPFFMNIIPKRRRKVGGGAQISRRLQMDTNGQAKHVAPYEQDDVQAADLLETITVPWRYSLAQWGIEKKVIEANTGPEQIVDLVKVNRNACLGDFAKLMESTILGDCGTDTKTPYGIQQWIVPNATAGFNGGNPNSHSSGIGGMSSTRYTAWANWTNVYSAVTQDDLIDKLIEAVAKTNFVSPIGMSSTRMKQEAFADHQLFMNYITRRKIEKVMESRNDNMGKDILQYMNATTVKGHPLIWVPYLDSSDNWPVDASGNTGVVLDPIYMINWSNTYFVCQHGKYMSKTGPMKSPQSHETIVVFYDTTWNLVCDNRRDNAILYNNSGTALS